MRLLVSTLLLLTPLFIFAQVINTEKLRLDKKDSGWLGDLGLNFGLTRNKAGQTVALGTNGRIEHVQAQQSWLLFGAYNLSQFLDVDDSEAVPKNFTNNAFGHLRYNRRINPLITWEAFVQGQYDEIQEIEHRFLAGAGPRFRIVEQDSLQLFLGALYMYEDEASNETEFINSEEIERTVFHHDHRLSAYASIGWRIRDAVVVNHVTYFQPRLDLWSDYRISSESSLSVQLSTKLRFNAYFQLVYDTQPPNSVPNTMFVLRNGLSYEW